MPGFVKIHWRISRQCSSAGDRFYAAQRQAQNVDLRAMADRLNPKTRIVIVANPNNPTGTIVRKAELNQFLDKVPEHALVILDEAYFEFVNEPDYPNAFDYFREGRNVVILRTFSKAYGLAGLRIGYAIARQEIIETLHKARMSFNVASLAQAAALAAWDDREHVQRTVENNRQELEFLYRELDARGMRYVPSFANFVMIDMGRPSMDVNAALIQKGVIIRPLAPWGLPTMIRVSIGTHEQNVKFLKAFDQLQ
jgi:histidinol-phosphate aminotransferase